MWQLPALEAGNKTVRLPLTDWAAQQISAALLTEGAEQRQAIWVQALRQEPALVLWGLCVAPQYRETPPASLDDLAAWLSQAALTVLAERRPCELPCSAISDAQRRRWSELAVRGAAAEDASSPPADEPASTDTAEIFTRRIGDPLAWVIGGENGPGDFPHWLRQTRPELDAAAVAPADPRDDAGVDAPAQNIRRRWQAPPMPSVAVLGPLVTRLVRLQQLEHDFARQLRDAKLASLKELAYGASHEINNPLANIATRAQTLLADEADPERRRKLATIAAQAFRAHEMISDLMLFARPPALRRQRSDLVGVVANALHEMAAEARTRQVTLRQTGGSEPVWADVDSTQLGVALNSLLRNSLEAIEGPGIVEVSLSIQVEANHPTANAKALIAVRDSGRGIAPSARAHLFDPFFSGREAGRGLGFGLSKCWRIVTDHGGDVRAEDAEGGGAVFTMELPLPGQD